MKGKEPMAEKSAEKSLEMRVAELEDKLAKLHVTEAELKTYQKVAIAMLQAGAVRPCVVFTCIVRCVVNCIFECTCGPCLQSGGGGGFGGFGGLGQ